MGEVIVYFEDKEVSRHPIGEEPLFIGRGIEDGLVLADNVVSKRHAVLIEKGGSAGLRDLDSSNGTFVNESRITGSVRLADGDVIRIGSYSLRYHAKSLVPAGGIIEPSPSSGASPPVGDFDPGAPTAKLTIEPDFSSDHAAPSGKSVEAPDESLVGEFIEASASEEIETPSGADRCEPLEVPDSLQKIIQARLSIWSELDKLEDERKVILEEETPESVQTELRRQRRELQELLTADRAATNIQKRMERFLAHQAKVEAGEAEEHPASMVRSMDLANRQWNLFVRREEAFSDLLQETSPIASEEPLYESLQRRGIDSRKLFACAIYCLALGGISNKKSGERKRLRMQRSALDQQSSGFFNRIRGKSEELKDKAGSFQSTEDGLARILSHVGREIQAMEKEMVAEFWQVYEQVAISFVSKDISGEEQVTLRAFLRYGLLGRQPWFLPGDVVEHLVRDSAESVTTAWDFSSQAQHILYADEYIEAVARGDCTPSIDENIELNLRNTSVWKGDRAWRRLVHYRAHDAVLQEAAKALEIRIGELRKAQDAMELERGKLARSAPDYKKRHAELAQDIQRRKVEAARFERAVDKIKSDYLPKLYESREDARSRLAASGAPPSVEDLVRREVAGIHRLCRLCSNLKDRFLPFTLRDSYRLETGVVNSREVMLQEMEKLEECDPGMFIEPLIRVKQKRHRIPLRYAPAMLISPACGFMGYSWNPRTSGEIGRLGLPGYFPRSGLRERLLYNLFADFVWDTSRAKAGVDLLTSETLVASYASVRWDYRKRGREAREKAGIFNEDNDRKNWRRHYEMYMSSARDGGKKLFFRNCECYEQVMLKYMDLPEGVDRLYH